MEARWFCGACALAVLVFGVAAQSQPAAAASVDPRKERTVVLSGERALQSWLLRLENAEYFVAQDVAPASTIVGLCKRYLAGERGLQSALNRVPMSGRYAVARFFLLDGFGYLHRYCRGIVVSNALLVDATGFSNASVDLQTAQRYVH